MNIESLEQIRDEIIDLKERVKKIEQQWHDEPISWENHNQDNSHGSDFPDVPHPDHESSGFAGPTILEERRMLP